MTGYQSEDRGLKKSILIVIFCYERCVFIESDWNRRVDYWRIKFITGMKLLSQSLIILICKGDRFILALVFGSIFCCTFLIVFYIAELSTYISFFNEEIYRDSLFFILGSYG